jgi:release factor glutamine methyltransferase
MMFTVEALLAQSTNQLQKAGSMSPSLDAGILLCHALGKPRSFLWTWPDKIVESADMAVFEVLLQRRLLGEPIAYIVGEREFWSLPLKVSPATLIPRPETEQLVEAVLARLPEKACSILDLGTGTGAIALALASERSDCQVIGGDVREEAVALASENGVNLGIKNAKFVLSSWFDAFSENDKFSVIVSNPPYIDETDPHLSEGDVRFEPSSALVADDAGFADLRSIAMGSRSHLYLNGWLLMEHGHQQGCAVRQILTDMGYAQVETIQDLAGLDRITLGCWTS